MDARDKSCPFWIPDDYNIMQVSPLDPYVSRPPLRPFEIYLGASSRKRDVRTMEMALGRELPDDLVTEILRRLPPRSLAVSCCVCRAWRGLIDGRRLLRADLLPRAVRGIFINYCKHEVSEFLARPTPTTGPSISADLEFIPGVFEVVDHCNGLVLCTQTRGDHDVDCVANPATRQWAWLPLPPPQMREEGFRQSQCLVYDPAVSPHYHVFLIGSSSLKSALQVYVYSSVTGRWEERWFAPEVPVVETTTIAVDDHTPLKVYWRGRLYVLCENGLVLRISISNANYRLIPTPGGVAYRHPGFFSLGRSEKGVYCAVYCGWYQFQIFHLSESCGQIVWELRHSVNLETIACNVYRDQPNRPWILEDIKYYKYSYRGIGKHKKVVEDNFEWNSDDDNVLCTKDMVKGPHKDYTTTLLGFHPYKEVLFFNVALSRAIAYHWNTSKLQDLGNICPEDYPRDAGGLVACIETSFIYTPCWMEDFPKT